MSDGRILYLNERARIVTWDTGDGYAEFRDDFDFFGVSMWTGSRTISGTDDTGEWTVVDADTEEYEVLCTGDCTGVWDRLATDIEAVREAVATGYK